VVLQVMLQEQASRQPDAKNSRDLTEICSKYRTIQNDKYNARMTAL